MNLFLGVVSKNDGNTVSFWESNITVAIISALVALLVGGLTIWVNYLTNKQKIKADLLAKTRLEWIREVREITSKIIFLQMEFYSILTKYNIEYFRLIDSGKECDKSEVIKAIRENFSDEIKENYNKRIEYKQLFKLYFAEVKYKKIKKDIYKSEENKENINIHKLLDELTNESDTIRHNYLYNDENKILRFNDKISTPKVGDFRKGVSEYLKKEWDKAKNNS